MEMVSLVLTLSCHSPVIINMIIKNTTQSKHPVRQLHSISGPSRQTAALDWSPPGLIHVSITCDTGNWRREGHFRRRSLSMIQRLLRMSSNLTRKVPLLIQGECVSQLGKIINLWPSICCPLIREPGETTSVIHSSHSRFHPTNQPPTPSCL